MPMNLALRVALGAAAVAAGGAAAAWVFAARSAWVPPEPLVVQVQTLDIQPPPSPEQTIEAGSGFRATVDRPLFAAARRPLPPPEAGGAKEPDPLQGVRFYGSYTAGNRTGIIVATGAEPMRVERGATVGGWAVDSADGRVATLVAGGKTRRLELPLRDNPDGDLAATGAGAAAPAGAKLQRDARPVSAPRSAAAAANDPAFQQLQEQREKQRAAIQARRAAERARRAGGG